MSQKQLVAKMSIHFTDFGFFTRLGDICKFDTNTGSLVVYRNGDLLATLKTSNQAVNSMLENKWFEEIKAEEPVAPPPPSEPEPAPLKTPKPEVKVEEKVVEEEVEVEPPPVEEKKKGGRPKKS